MKKKLLKDVKARRVWTRKPLTAVKESSKLYSRTRDKKRFETVSDMQLERNNSFEPY